MPFKLNLSRDDAYCSAADSAIRNEMLRYRSA